jgi:hypothetical protein
MIAGPSFSIIGPSLADARTLLLVPKVRRCTVAALWQLEAKLFAIILSRREDMLAQIKLVWWRDRLHDLAVDRALLPLGEPLLADLAKQLPQSVRLGPLPDAFEAVLAMDSEASAESCAISLAAAMSEAMGDTQLPPSAFRQWAYVRAGQLSPTRALAQYLWRRAAASPSSGAPADHGLKHAMAGLNRWALLIARQQGTLGGPAEAWLMLRLALRI